MCLVSVGGAVAGGGGGGGGRDRVGELAGGWVKRRGDFTQVGVLGSRGWCAGEASADQANEEPRGSAVVDGFGAVHGALGAVGESGLGTCSVGKCGMSALRAKCVGMPVLVAGSGECAAPLVGVVRPCAT